MRDIKHKIKFICAIFYQITQFVFNDPYFKLHFFHLNFFNDKSLG